MSNKLVIIESPGKLKSYRKYLPANYNVLASVGHIYDLPPKDIGVDIDNNFTPTFVVMKGKEDTLKEIKSAAAKADEVLIATDPDREGAGIGWNIAQNLPKGKKVKRIKTQSITKAGIETAISQATDLSTEKNLVEAFNTRRILDRICGWKTSFLVKRATGGTSAGRTQSAGLRVLAEREKEIAAFVPEEYWPIWADLLREQGNDRILAFIKKPNERDIKNGEEAQKIVDVIKKGPAIVSKFEKKEIATRANAPFTTSTMYQAAGGAFGWKSDKTASVAQSLYEAGVITYHRTDSTFLVPEFVTAVREMILSEYGKPYVPTAINSFGVSKNAQEAHEACRVTNLANKDYLSGTSDEAKLYKMIWKRSVSCQMSELRKLAISAEFKVQEYLLSATGSKLLFDGWRKVWDYGDITDTMLPELVVGEKFKVLDVKTEQKFTEPPPRYNERSFIKKLEQEGIGRPSTYAAIPKTLSARQYIDNGKNIIVTPLGMKVNDFLAEHGFCFAEIQFTAGMEEKLDDIATNKKNKIDVLNEFWNRLKTDIDKAKTFKKDKILTTFKCLACDNFLEKKTSRYGDFYGCSTYPKCKETYLIGEDGNPVKKKPKEYAEFECPKCKKKMIKRQGKYGDFYGCSGFPKCKTMCDLEGKMIETKKSFKKFPRKKKSQDEGLDS